MNLALAVLSRPQYRRGWQKLGVWLGSFLVFGQKPNNGVGQGCNRNVLVGIFKRFREGRDVVPDLRVPNDGTTPQTSVLMHNQNLLTKKYLIGEVFVG